MRRLTLLAATAQLLLAQTQTGTIQGTVEDSSAAVIPGATIRITNVHTNESRHLQTNVTGAFVQPFLLPGTYSVVAEKEGFQSVRQDNIKLDVGQNRTVNLRLEVGRVTQEVLVQAARPPLDVNTSAMGQVVENKRIIDLPLNGRNVFALTNLTPGVNPTGGTLSPGLAGGRSNANEIHIDGSTASSAYHVGVNSVPYTPQVDAVEEFNVQISTLSAEYGRFNGGVVNVATKSGTNQLHGTAYDYLRNSKMDANNFFANRAGKGKGSFKRNQWGGTAGGPVYLPRLYDGRNKTFLFAGFQATQPRSRAVSSLTVPTPEWRQGDFSSLRNANGAVVTVYDPATVRQDPANPLRFIRTPFPGNRIPQDRLDPIAQKLVSYYPQPNARPVNPYTQTENFVTSGVSPTDAKQLDTRLDHNVTDMWRIFLRTSFSTQDNAPFNAFGNAATSVGGFSNTDRQTSVAMDHTVTWSPTVLINFRYGFNRTFNIRKPDSLGIDLTTLGLPKSIQAIAPVTYFPRFSVGSLEALGVDNSTYVRWAGMTHVANASLTRVLTRHTIKTGFEYRKYLMNHGQPGDPVGAYNFNSGWTQQEVNTSSLTAGFPMASFLLGLPGGGNISHDAVSSTASSYYAGYLQDDWKAGRRLTLNLGIRYDIDLPFTSRYNEQSYFLPYDPSPIAGKIPASACPSCGNLSGAMHFLDADRRRVAPTDRNNFAPRVGLAWNASDNLAVRAGYGISYQASVLQAGPFQNFTEGYKTTTPVTASFDGMLTVNARLSNPFPNGFTLPRGRQGGPATNLGFAAGNSNFNRTRVPYVQLWNVNIQRTLPGNMVAEAGYLGNRGIGLPDLEGYSYNQLPASFMSMGPELLKFVPNPFAGVITDPTSTLGRPTVQLRQLLRPYPQYTNVTTFRAPTAADSIYHGMTIRLDKRFSRGLSFLLAYTAGKLIDNASSEIHFLGPQGGGKLDNYNIRLERSVSAMDVAQRLVLSGVYELPVGAGRRYLSHSRGIVDGVLGGWQLNGITTFQSGLPMMVRPAFNNTNIYSGQRPNNNGRSAHLSGGSPDARLARWFDTSVFSQPADYTFGNVGRVLPDVRQPGTRGLTDLSIFKTFGLLRDKRLRLQYRLEAFQAFNNPRWGAPGNTVGGGGFGVISSSSGERQLQMALKLIW